MTQQLTKNPEQNADLYIGHENVRRTECVAQQAVDLVLERYVETPSDQVADGVDRIAAIVETKRGGR